MGKKDKEERKEKGEKEPKSEKKRKADAEETEEESSKKQRLISPIANPLCGKKLVKLTLKTLKSDTYCAFVRSAAGAKAVRRGVKEVVKAVGKGEQGVCVIAGDISPIDVIAHVPILCEEKGVPYAYVPSKEELGTASLTKRPTSIVLITCKPGADYKEAFEQLRKEFHALLPKFD
eukprot:6212034-Pleurochrysis_carterae.AAC.3